MDELVFVLCGQEEYVSLMGDYLIKKACFPGEVHTYVSVEDMVEREQSRKITLLAIAESSMSELAKTLNYDRIVILNETGLLKWSEYPNVNKYQCADEVIKELIEQISDLDVGACQRFTIGATTKFIGLYSPVKRNYQTSFALSVCRILSERHRVLYMNFEHYSGIGDLLPSMNTRDLADLIYYLSQAGDKFVLRFKAIVSRYDEFDYIPPVKVGENLLAIQPECWKSLMKKIEELGEYDYVIMDLSESIHGLFEILKECYCIYTLSGQDGRAKSKIRQYEEVLNLHACQNILEKTKMCFPPKIKVIPEDIELYEKATFLSYVKQEINELVTGR